MAENEHSQENAQSAKASTAKPKEAKKEYVVLDQLLNYLVPREGKTPLVKAYRRGQTIKLTDAQASGYLRDPRPSVRLKDNEGN